LGLRDVPLILERLNQYDDLVNHRGVSKGIACAFASTKKGSLLIQYATGVRVDLGVDFCSSRGNSTSKRESGLPKKTLAA